jgi:hypothetical protein
MHINRNNIQYSLKPRNYVRMTWKNVSDYKDKVKTFEFKYYDYEKHN